jgi:hypothetical protein
VLTRLLAERLSARRAQTGPGRDEANRRDSHPYRLCHQAAARRATTTDDARRVVIAFWALAAMMVVSWSVAIWLTTNALPGTPSAAQPLSLALTWLVLRRCDLPALAPAPLRSSVAEDLTAPPEPLSDQAEQLRHCLL